MKIKDIQLINIGPYAGNNRFDFHIENSTKKIILIGGKNGSGKTTLFNAIKICLYGCAAYGLASNTGKYLEKIENIINVDEKQKKTGTAEVIIDLLFDDGKHDNIYKFDRKWRISSKRITEKFELYKNNEPLSETTKSDFESYLLQLLPPDLFGFYFFDGEKIGDFAVNNENSDFKEAFLKLCNLDTLEIICENFRRVSRNKSKDGFALSEEYNKRLDENNLWASKVAGAEEESRQATKEIAGINESLASLEKEYAKNGGISKKEWYSMQDQLAKEEIKRDEIRKWLKDVANNILPFIILRTNLEGVKKLIAAERKAQIGANVRDSIDTPEVKSLLIGVLEDAAVGQANSVAEKLVSAIVNYESGDSISVTILNLSDFDRYELTAKINVLLSFDVNRVKEATDEIAASLKRVKKIRQKMERSSIDSYDGYFRKKSELNEKKSSETFRLLEIEKRLQQELAEKETSALKLAKAKKDYEMFLKKRSIGDMSARALLAFEELLRLLYDKSVRRVETYFGECFSALINKTDLIDGILIDDNLNVLPYKNEKYNVEELKKTIEKNGSKGLIAKIGVNAYAVFRKADMTHNVEIELPVEVKRQFSAGEKQIFIMALYQALSHLNIIDIPYIVDTPFARIDKEHRGKILERFFKKLNGQVIILSTDEEIAGKYYEAISAAVSDKFILTHTADGNTKIEPDIYFGERL